MLSVRHRCSDPRFACFSHFRITQQHACISSSRTHRDVQKQLSCQQRQITQQSQQSSQKQPQQQWSDVQREEQQSNGTTSTSSKAAASTLRSQFLNFDWQPWKLPGGVPSGFWHDKHNHKLFLDVLARDLGIETWTDWYGMTRKQIAEHGGSGLLKHYDNSPSLLIVSVLSQHPWQLWKFAGGIPTRFWDDVTLPQQFFEWLEKELQIKTTEDWYDVTANVIHRAGGGALLARFNDSPIQLVQAFYPSYEWLPWRFAGGVPDNYWDSEQHQRHFLQTVGDQLGVKELDDWYNVTTRQIMEAGGSGLLQRYYNGNLRSMLLALFPHHTWLLWKFAGGAPHGFWDDSDHRRQCLEYIAKELKIAEWQDWYKVTAQEFQDHRGGGLLHKYNDRIALMIPAILPQHDWKPWLFSGGAPDGFWGNPQNQKLFMDWVADELQVKHWEDWYHVTFKQVRQKGGANLLLHYHGLPALLQAVYSEHSWQLWKFVGGVPSGYWDRMENQQKFIESLARDLNITQWEEWYQVTAKQVSQKGGAGLLQMKYNNSMALLLPAVLPQYPWLRWRFHGGAPEKFWENSKNQHQCVEWLMSQIGIRDWQEWYKVTQGQVQEAGGSSLLAYFRNSVPLLCQTIFPYYHWLPWRFVAVSSSLGFWNDDSNVRFYFDWLIEQHHLSGPEAIARLPASFFRKNHGRSLLTQLPLLKALEVAYPNIDWRRSMKARKQTSKWKPPKGHLWRPDWWNRRSPTATSTMIGK